jgi:hypothetical protein
MAAAAAAAALVQHRTRDSARRLGAAFLYVVAAVAAGLHSWLRLISGAREATWEPTRRRAGDRG